MVSRGEKISILMLRTLCGCKSNKVDEKSTAIELANRETVFVFVSHNVLQRCLLGGLIDSLEQRNLRPVELTYSKPTKEAIEKSQIYKIGKYDENLTCVISLWRGRYASSRAIESIRLYIRAKGLERADIRYTDHVAFTNKEYELWFGRPVPGNSESSGQATSNVANQPAAIENAAEAEKNEEIKREDPENSEKAEGEKDSDSNAPTASVVSINHPVELTSGNGGVSGTEAQSLQPPAINEIPPTNREESSGEK